MQTFKNTLHYLFQEPGGHFTLTFGLLCVCGIGAVFGVPHAAAAVNAVWPIVLAKLRT